MFKKSKMTEYEMEQYLMMKEYDIYYGDKDDCVIDSTKIIDIANDLGFKSIMDDKTGEITFLIDRSM